MKDNLDGKLILNVGIGAIAAYAIIQGVKLGVGALNNFINQEKAKGGAPQATNPTQAPQS